MTDTIQLSMIPWYWTDHLLILFLTLLLPARSVMGGSDLLEGLILDSRTKRRLYWSNNLWMWLLATVVLVNWISWGRNATALGLTDSISVSPLIGLAAIGFVAVYVLDMVRELRTASGRQQNREELASKIGFLPVNGYEFLHFMSVAITAGICEEIIFRAYLIRYFEFHLSSADPSRTLAVVLTAVIFGLIHLYQGWQAVIKICGLSIALGFLFLYTDSLWINILIHILIDLIGGFLAWQLLKRRT